MQVDRMFTAKAAITIKQNKKAESGTSIQGKGDPALSYNGTKSETRKNSFKSSAMNLQAKGGKKKRNCESTDGEKDD